ncbi:MAG: amino acid ABC transporter permease [Clostridia bacterium]|nr:amino acid ABC transporter permease [Clostridia bacterium]
MENWLPFWDINNIEFFYFGFKLTIGLAVVSIFLSLVFGILLALMRTSGWRILIIPAYLYTHALRNSPLILIIFFTYFALPKVGLSLSPFWAGVTALTIFTSALVAEIFRGGIQSISKGQWEAARAQGFSWVQTMWHIILPQAFKKIIPPLVSQFTSLIKDTAYCGLIISVPELFSQGQIFFSRYNNPVQTLAVLAVVYFVICYALTEYSRRLERKMAHGQ